MGFVATGAAAMTCERGPTLGETQCPSPRQTTPSWWQRQLGSGCQTVPSMARATIVVFGSGPEGFRLRGASRYPMSEGSVLRSCLDPPRRSVRHSGADLG